MVWNETEYRNGMQENLFLEKYGSSIGISFGRISEFTSNIKIKEFLVKFTHFWDKQISIVNTRNHEKLWILTPRIKRCQIEGNLFYSPISYLERFAKIFRGCHLVLMPITEASCLRIAEFALTLDLGANLKSCVWNEPMHLKQGCPLPDCPVT